jgi:hypothetical protein
MTGVKAAHQRVSFSDMEKWPEDGRRYELYDGEVYVVPSLIPLHQIVAARLYLALEEYTRVDEMLPVASEQQEIGLDDVVLGQHDVERREEHDAAVRTITGRSEESGRRS